MDAPLLCRRVERRGDEDGADGTRPEVASAGPVVATEAGGVTAAAGPTGENEASDRAGTVDPMSRSGASGSATPPTVADAAPDDRSIAGTITLDETDRHRRRLAMTSDQGLPFVLSLDTATLLRDGDRLVLDDGRRIVVRAAPEPLYEVRGTDPHHLLRLAWHMGNRHLPTQLMSDHLRIRRDAVIGTMLRGLGADVRDVEAGFDPEGGAYGDRHGHEHEHENGHGHGHGHGQGQGQGHDIDATGVEHRPARGPAHTREAGEGNTVRARGRDAASGPADESERVRDRRLTASVADRRHER